MSNKEDPPKITVNPKKDGAIITVEDLDTEIALTCQLQFFQN